jgi:hypothetical protein
MKECKKITNYFSDFLKDEEEKISSTLLKCRERHLNHFQKWLIINKNENATPEDIDEEILIKYKNFIKEKTSSRGKKVSKTTQKSYLRTIRFFFEFLKNKNIECINPEKIRLDKKVESGIQKVVNHYFKTKGLTLEELKKSAKKQEIIYSRYTKPAKQLLELSGSIEKAKESITKVANWANSRNLDYTIETVLKKWLEIKNLEPKKIEKKPFYRGDRMVKKRGKWYVIDNQGEWLEFAGKEEDIVWKEE